MFIFLLTLLVLAVFLCSEAGRVFLTVIFGIIFFIMSVGTVILLASGGG